MSQLVGSPYLIKFFYIYLPQIFTQIGFPVWHKISGKKKLFSIDPNVKGAMSEMFDKSQMSETIDIPVGWTDSLWSSIRKLF